MNFDQFVAGFQNPQESRLRGEPVTQAPVGEVTIAGTMVSATRDLCRVDINGAQYEIRGGDVVDIADLAAAVSGKEGEAKGEPAPAQGGRLVLIKVPGDAMLDCRMSVPAALVAAAGTWLQVVPGATGMQPGAASTPAQPETPPAQPEAAATGKPQKK